MSVNVSLLLRDLKADKTSSEALKKTWDMKRREYISQWIGLPYGNEQEGKSAIVSKDIKKQSEWQHASIIDPFVSTASIVKCAPITYEDAPAAHQNELLLNSQFCRKFDRYNFMTKAVKVLDREGTVVIQTGWDYEDYEVDAEVEDVQTNEYGEDEVVMVRGKKTIVKKNQPTAKICRNEDIYIDPTCEDDMDKCQFVIYRYETDISSLRKDGRYKNLDRLAKSLGAGTYDSDYRPEDYTRFQFTDDARKKIIVYEYWGNYDIDEDGIAEPIVCAWVNDIVIRLQDNPFPDGKPPFIIVPFNSVPFQMYGEANAELIGDNQKVKTAIIRGIIDNMAQSNNGQVGIRKGALDPVNRKKWVQGKNFEFNGSQTDFWQGSFNPLPSSVFDMIGLQNNEIESLTGTKSFSGGINGSSLGTMLDINTNIPMMDGSWKKLGAVADGDILIGSNGKGTKVIKAHEIKYPKRAYDMVFDNEVTVKSGGEHLWTVKVQSTSHKLREWTTITADEVYEHTQKGRKVTIPKMKELHVGTPATSSIDPYVLGFWLGDGNNHSARITTMDYEIVEHFSDAGYSCVEVLDSSKSGKATMYDVYKKGFEPKRDEVTGQYISTGSLHSELRDLGLHKRYGGEKHIPDMFLSATYEEKMELIRGLMDSDGFAHSGSFVQFTQSEGRLQKDFIKLIESLGLKVSVRIRSSDSINKAKLKRSENNNTKMIWSRKDSYEIGFTPWSNPFKLSRKANKWKEPRTKTVKLTSMEKVDKVLMRCLTVDSSDKLFAVSDRYILTHNTATGARGAMDSTSVRRMNIVRNIAENLVKPILRKWMAYNAEFLEEEEVVRVTNEQFVPVRKDDLEGRIDIDLTIATAEDQSAKSQQLSFLLQTLGNTIDPEITKELMAQILDLSRMPDQAKKLRDYQPQVDPMEQQMKQLTLEKLQLENAKLKSDVSRNDSIAAENEIDRKLKSAKADRETAQARVLHSKADLEDLNFLQTDSGVQHNNQLQLAELTSKAELDKQAMINMGQEKAHENKINIESLKHHSHLDSKALDAMIQERQNKLNNNPTE